MACWPPALVPGLRSCRRGIVPPAVKSTRKASRKLGVSRPRQWVYMLIAHANTPRVRACVRRIGHQSTRSKHGRECGWRARRGECKRISIEARTTRRRCVDEPTASATGACPRAIRLAPPAPARLDESPNCVIYSKATCTHDGPYPCGGQTLERRQPGGLPRRPQRRVPRILSLTRELVVPRLCRGARPRRETLRREQFRSEESIEVRVSVTSVRGSVVR